MRTSSRPATHDRRPGKGRRRTLAGLSSLLLGLTMVPATLLAPAHALIPAPSVGNGFTVTPTDLAFILKQIKIAERHSRAFEGTEPGVPPNPHPKLDPDYCSALVGPAADQVPDPLTSYGLRTVDGSCNNLVAPTSGGQFSTRPTFGAADQVFPRLTTPIFRDAEDVPPGFGPPGPPVHSSYKQKQGNVFDSQPRVISNLIVDQTSTNPAAVAAAEFPVRTQGNKGVVPCATEPGPDGTGGLPAGCVPAHQTLFIPNVTTDVGLSPPYNSLFTFFGQFFDHGVDQTVKSGSTVFVPLKADDPLRTVGADGIAGTNCDTPAAAHCDEVPPSQAFMVLTRAQNQPGPDGVLGTNDDIQDASNTDTPWADQSQTYTSHPSHQVFIREYALNSLNHPVSTGKLLGGLAAGQTYDNSPDGTTGIGTWKAVKAQAKNKLGLLLTDADVTNVPMMAVDPYGQFIPGPLRGLPQYVTKTGTVEGNLANPVPVPANVVHFDTPFVADIAHNADPSPQTDPATGNVTVPTPDVDHDSAGNVVHTPSADFADQPPGTYDDEMLDAHFACGDGRCNENIALSSIHQVFHSEHDRLVDYIKGVLTSDTSDTGLKALPEWQLPTAQSPDGWNGERLFQAARFVTEMEYQHLVFEEFARKVQPAIRPFHVYSPDMNPAIKAEFAHAVYRFGHSMLDDTVARVNEAPDGTKTDNSVPLLTAFLNPPEYFHNGSSFYTPEQAAGSILMGSSDQVGNELDEFVTETLRNNLLGLPLDLASINMARAREAGVPPLNDVRRQIFAETNDGQLAPYTSWSDFGQHLKHPESLINFVAAYGTHPSITGATTLVAKRDAARAIVDPQLTDHPPADAADFMFSTGAWATPASGVTTTGLDTVDLWVGGLAEVTNLNGGLLGSTFNYVFQNQLESLQDGDRFYYLFRTPGLNLRSQLEGNSFGEMIERNTTGTFTLKADVFATSDCKFELGDLTFPAPAGSAITGQGSVADDPKTECDENALLLRKPDGTIQYRAINTVDPSGINGQSVYNGTDDTDRVIGGNDNDTIWGNKARDILEGNGGDDVVLGGDGPDIITDLDGADVLKGGPGNDAEDGGPDDDIVIGGDDQDFLNGGANDNETFAGPGNDYIIAGQGADSVFGDDGDDWIEGGSGQDLLQGDHGAPFFDDPAQAQPGNDIFVGQVGENDYDAEGGDDLMAQNAAIDRNAGAAGFDWAFHQYDTVGGDDDMEINQQLVGLPLPIVVNRDRWQETEADSGSDFNDIIRGDDLERVVGPGGFSGCDALDPTGVARITGLNKLVTSFPSSLKDIVDDSAMKYCPLRGAGGSPSDLSSGAVWAEGNILLGGGGSDLLEGRGNNDIIDGDHALSVRISVRANKNGTGAELGSTDLMENTAVTGTFGAGTAGMTLQQAVFAGLVDPGQLVSVREITDMGVTPDKGVDGDCGAANPTNCDTALYSTARDQYTINRNSDGSVTVAFNAPAAAPGALFTKGDGTDTLWNIENLRFCTGTDAVTKKCNAFDNVAVSSLPITTPVTATLSATSAAFGPVAVGAASDTRTITITNTGTGTGTLNVSGALVTGADADQFTATNNCTSIVGAGSCTVDVVFSPTSTGAKTAELDISSNASQLTQVVSLTGSGATSAPPAAPIGVTALPGLFSASVSWSVPAGAASNIDSFEIVATPPTGPVITKSGIASADRSAIVTGLTAGTPFTFRVRAVNGVGSSALSVASDPVTPMAEATAPDAPTIDSVDPGDGSVRVSWTAPANDGGSAITGYLVRVADADTDHQIGALRSAPAGATALDVDGLANGTAVRFQIQAKNGIGTGGFSARSDAVTPVATSVPPVQPPTVPPTAPHSAMPLAPGATTIGATRAGNASAVVHWTAPDNGGGAITGFTVRVIRSATGARVGALRSAGAGATSLRINGLVNGAAVRFQVRATNVVGAGAYSALSRSVTPSTVPGATTIGPASSGRAGGAVNAVARWTRPSTDGGSVVTGYVVTALRVNGHGVVVRRITSAVRPATARSLRMTLAAGHYRFIVQARNARGLGAKSARSGRVTAR